MKYTPVYRIKGVNQLMVFQVEARHVVCLKIFLKEVSFRDVSKKRFETCFEMCQSHTGSHTMIFLTLVPLLIEQV